MAWTQYNPNPVHPDGGVGDCAIRAIAKALDISWEQAYTKLNKYLCIGGSRYFTEGLPLFGDRKHELHRTLRS